MEQKWQPRKTVAFFPKKYHPSFRASVDSERGLRSRNLEEVERWNTDEYTVPCKGGRKKEERKKERKEGEGIKKKKKKGRTKRTSSAHHETLSVVFHRRRRSL